jgi:tagatose-1,6-bisphosphate aldolase non-catalytic subunit AgaZ/GatZ
LIDLVGTVVPMIGGKKRAQQQASIYQSQAQANLMAAQVEAERKKRTALIVKGVVGVVAIVLFGGVAVVAIRKITSDEPKAA